MSTLLITLLLAINPVHAAKGKKKDKPHQLDSAELPGSAHTMKKGEGHVNAIGYSAYGVAPKTEVGTTLRMLRWGPNVGLEQQLMGGGGTALSLGVGAFSNWGFDTQTLSAGLLYTKGAPKENRYNLGAGVGLTTTDPGSNLDRVNAVGTNLHGGYDLVLKPKRTLQLTLDVDPLNSVRAEAFVGNAAVAYNHGFKTVRVRAGLRVGDGIASGTVNSSLLVTEGIIDPLDVNRWTPMPFVDVWGHFGG